MLKQVNPCAPHLDRDAAEELQGQLQAFQSERRQHQWEPVRLIHNWDLMLLEQALGISLWHTDSPPRGYKLAADYCQHFDSRYGNGLNGPSCAKIKAIARFLLAFEKLENG